MDRDLKPSKLHLVRPPAGVEVRIPLKPELVASAREAVVHSLDVARRRSLLRLVPKPLAYCRPDNDQERR